VPMTTLAHENVFEYEGSGSVGQQPQLNLIVERHSRAELLAMLPPPDTRPNSLTFLFHNKLPKSGSSTMKHILQVLSKKNRFALDHVRIKKLDYDEDRRLLAHIEKFRNFHPGLPMVLLKHHTFVNFTQFGWSQPTYINVIRHPVSQFASFYYFQRFGWGLQQGKRKAFSGSQADRQRTMDECVAQRHPECQDALGVLNKYLCGGEEVCKEGRYHVKVKGDDGRFRWERRTDWDKLARATELSKINIVRHYHAIGILEHFDSSLKLFERTLPTFFQGATEAYHGEYVQKFVQLTKTKNSKSRYSNETLEAMAAILRYDMDIYNLAQAVLFQKLKYFSISP